MIKNILNIQKHYYHRAWSVCEVLGDMHIPTCNRQWKNYAQAAGFWSVQKVNVVTPLTTR